jgi:hypothetical protein
VTEPDIDRIERAYRELKDRLRGLGFVLPGSLTERWTTCGKTGCHCTADPPRRHGPYIEYTRKIARKTTGRRLTAQQAEQYRAWIANRRALDQITASMDELSQQAAQLLASPPP